LLPPHSTLFPSTPLFRSRHAVQVFEIEQENLDKVSYDSLVKAAVDAVMKEVTADIWGQFTVGNFPATPDVVGPLSSFDYDAAIRSEEHTSELQSLRHLVC